MFIPIFHIQVHIGMLPPECTIFLLSLSPFIINSHVLHLVYVSMMLICAIPESRHYMPEGPFVLVESRTGEPIYTKKG